MSTRYQMTRHNTDGSYEALFFKNYSREVVYYVAEEIKAEWYSAEAVAHLFANRGIQSAERSGVYQRFYNEAEYREHLKNGEGCVVEYIFLWDTNHERWSLIYLNDSRWKECRFFYAGVVLSPRMRHGSTRRGDLG